MIQNYKVHQGFVCLIRTTTIMTTKQIKKTKPKTLEVGFSKLLLVIPRNKQ